MRNVYLVPKNGMTGAEYNNYCASLPYIWQGDLVILVAENRVTTNATLENFELLNTVDETIVVIEDKPVPKSVTKRQALQALIISEKDEQVIALLDSMTGIEGKLARAEWAESSTVERNRPLVKQMAIGLEMTEKELDDLFILAATL